jgi:methionyl-tRNA formyltransferase
MLDECLPDMAQGIIRKTPQDLSKGSYFGGRKPQDGKIDWNAPAIEIYNLIRGVTHPYPGAFGMMGGENNIFWKALPDSSFQIEAGRINVTADRVYIGTGSGSIIPLSVEADGKILEGAELLLYFKTHEGELLT